MAAAMTAIGALIEDVGWTGLIVLTIATFAAIWFIAERTFRTVTCPSTRRPSGDGALQSLPDRYIKTFTGEIIPRETYDNDLQSETETDRAAKHDLARFLLDVLSPALNAQENCINHIVQWLDTYGTLSSYVLASIKQRQQAIAEGDMPPERIAGDGRSLRNIPLPYMEKQVYFVSAIQYKNGMTLIYEDLLPRRMRLKDAPDNVKDAYNEWIARHNRLVDEYEAIGTDLRFKVLYNPRVVPIFGRKRGVAMAIARIRALIDKEPS